MSDQAPERTTSRPSSGGGQHKRGGNVFTRKLGPFPMWLWLVIVGGIIIAWAYYEYRTNAANTTTGTTTGQAQVPQFVNQTFTGPYPPPPPDKHHHHKDHHHKRRRIRRLRRRKRNLEWRGDRGPRHHKDKDHHKKRRSDWSQGTPTPAVGRGMKTPMAPLGPIGQVAPPQPLATGGAVMPMGMAGGPGVNG